MTRRVFASSPDWLRAGVMINQDGCNRCIDHPFITPGFQISFSQELIDEIIDFI